jgi:hypothetical protein
MKPQADIAHVAFWDVPFMLAASKNRSYRESQLVLAEAIATVYTERKLAATDWVAMFHANPEAFRVRVGDLTPEGFAFAPAFQLWLKKTDRWTTSRTLEKLRASLIAHIDEYRGASA